MPLAAYKLKWSVNLPVHLAQFAGTAFRSDLFPQSPTYPLPFPIPLSSGRVLVVHPLDVRACVWGQQKKRRSRFESARSLPSACKSDRNAVLATATVLSPPRAITPTTTTTDVILGNRKFKKPVHETKKTTIWAPKSNALSSFTGDPQKWPSNPP